MRGGRKAQKPSTPASCARCFPLCPSPPFAPPKWKDLGLGFVIHRADAEESTLNHCKDNFFGVADGGAREAGEAKRTVLLDETRSFFNLLGNSEYSVAGVFLQLLSGYWLPGVIKGI